MAETVRLVDYYSMEVSDKAGAALQILEQLCEADVYLLTFSDDDVGGGGDPRGAL